MNPKRQVDGHPHAATELSSRDISGRESGEKQWGAKKREAMGWKEKVLLSGDLLGQYKSSG